MKLIKNGIYTNDDQKFMILKVTNSYVAVLILDCGFRDNKQLNDYINELMYVKRTWHNYTRILPISDSLIKNIDGYLGQFDGEKLWI